MMKPRHLMTCHQKVTILLFLYKIFEKIEKILQISLRFMKDVHKKNP